MKAKDIIKLKKDNKVIHRQLGICTVVRVEKTMFGELFGLIILPDTQDGRDILRCWSGTPDDMPMIETSYRLIKSL